MPLRKVNRWPARNSTRIGILGEDEDHLLPLKRGDKVKIVVEGRVKDSPIGRVLGFLPVDGRYEVRFRKKKDHHGFTSIATGPDIKLYTREELVSEADEAPQNVVEALCT